MAGDNTGCPAEIDPCNYSFPAMYHGTTVGDEISAHLEMLACDANDRSYCGLLDICTAEGELLTLIGNRLGWPREHCSVKPVDFFGFDCNIAPPVGTGCDQASVVGLCDGAYFFCRLEGAQNYTFTDDELYRSFLKAVAIKNRIRRNKQIPNVKLVDEIIKTLWGNNAWVVEATNGAIGVSAGRDLTADEICLLSLYEQVICTGLGIRLNVYCTQPPSPCDVQCPSIPDFDKLIGTNFSYTSPLFQGAIGLTLTGNPPWMDFSFDITPTGAMFTVSATPVPDSTGVVTLIYTAQAPTGGQGCGGQLVINCIEPAVTLPTCPDDVSIVCDDLPYTLTGFSNVDSFSAASGYTVTPNAGNTAVVIDSANPSDGTVTVTATNADGSCDTNITITGCTTTGPTAPTLSGNDCGVQPAAPSNNATIFTADDGGKTVFCPFNGQGTLTSTLPAAWFVPLGNCYRIDIPANTAATGAIPYSVTLTNSEGSVTCAGNVLEVIGL